MRRQVKESRRGWEFCNRQEIPGNVPVLLHVPVLLCRNGWEMP